MGVAGREPYAREARQIRDGYLDGAHELLVPTLWLFEVGNILSIKLPRQAASQLELLCDLALSEYAPAGDWRALVLSLVHEHRVTFYDASYHATAMLAGGHLVSADSRYLRKVGQLGHTLFLGDWS